MSSLLTTTSGDDSGGTTISIDHHNNIVKLLNGTNANLIKLIANDANAFIIAPAASGYVAARNWLQIQDTAGAETLAIYYNGQIRSSLATGTAPFVVASTTAVTNLNSDMVDSIHALVLRPAGMVAFFNLSACPSGWTEVTALRGRVIVGLPAGGTLAGTVGSGLADLANRTISTVAAHTHGLSAAATASGGAHTHTIDVNNNSIGSPEPTTGATAVATRTTSSSGAHTHTLSGTTDSTGAATVDVTMSYVQYIACTPT